MIPPEWLDQAARRLEGQIERTPLTYDPELNLFLKWENRQRTGSFKIRGALNKVLALEPWERQRGLVTASAGNHGQGVAVAGQLTGAPVTVFASEYAVPAKLEAMRGLGAEIRLVRGGYENAERAAQAYARETGADWISPYNDGQVIAGQATVAMELFEQVQELAGAPYPEAIYVPVGGGGLISGVGVALNRLSQSSRPRLVGVQSVASPFFHALFYRGSQAGVVELESLADGLAGAVEDGSITIPLVRGLAAEIALVTEEMVAQAVAGAWHTYGEKIEGSSATALAAALRRAAPDRPAVVVVSGGNIQPEVHRQICSAHPGALFSRAGAPGVDLEERFDR
jgi:threonine dehydratase